MQPAVPIHASGASSAKGALLFGNRSIRFKLLFLMALNSSFALLLAGAGFLAYESIQYQSAATREVTTLADIVGAGSTGALSFSDERAAAETLQALSADRRIAAAAVYDKSNRLLARYPKDTGRAPPGQPQADGVYFAGSDLMIFRPVVLDRDRIGTVYLRSDTNEIHVRLLRYFGIVCGVLLASLGLGLALSARFQGVISGPIGALANLARRISVDKDYAVRAAKVADDEIGVLIDSFNEMLSQIEIRERDRKMAEDALRKSEERYALAAHGANDGLWDWKLDTNEIYFSPRWIRMLGYTDDEAWTDPEEWFSRIHPADRERVRGQLKAHCDGAVPEFSAEYRMLNKSGAYIWMLSRGIAVRDKNKVPFRIAGSQTDITEGKVADSLTELPNRLFFLDKLESAIASKRNPEARPFAVLFLDLDRFKVVNDSLGHAAGDQLLVGVAQRLRSSVRGQGMPTPNSASFTVARLGGDEFAILVEGLGQESDATLVADRILKRLGAAFPVEGRQVFAGVSIGIALSSSGETPEDLLRNADTAMYHAKAHGRGRFEVFEPGMRQRAIARMELEADLKRAVKAGEFVLHYQPKVSLATQRITGFEALIRWNHPTRGLLYPGEFISIAEETGLIVALGRWTLEEACRQLAVWHRNMPHRRPALSVSVNISFKQLAEPGLAEDIERILAETGVNPACLRAEMTESSIMENAQFAVATLRRLKELNIGLEIDDFGTGYSSLSYLRQLPFDTLKIDRSFVKELGGADDSVEIINTILQLARSLGLDVVAEGVETMDQLALLRTMGCGCGQGYYFSKPVDAGKAIRLVGEMDTLQAHLLQKQGHPALLIGRELEDLAALSLATGSFEEHAPVRPSGAPERNHVLTHE